MSANELKFDKASLYLKPSPVLKFLALAGIAVGLLAMAFGFGSGQGTRVWGAFLFNLFFFFCLGFGAMALAAMQDLIGATWGRPIRRIQEGFGAFVPVAALLFAFFIVAIMQNWGGAGAVYHWIADPSYIAHFSGKNIWLQPNLMYARVFLILAIFTSLVLWQLRLTTTRDRLWADGKVEEAHEYAEEVLVKSKFWSAPVIILFGVGFTFFCFDITMSLAAKWFSTLWGGWHFAVMMQTLMASLLIAMFSLRNTGVGCYIKRQQFHDVGKLLHGFTVFFAYLTFAHVLTYWYGNVPEETVYFIDRLKAPWIYFLFIVPIFGFVIPLYSLIFKAAKWTATITIPLACIVLFAQWCTYLVIVMPQVVDGSKFGSTLPVVEVGCFLGMLGLFLTTFFWFARRVPMLPVADPLLAEALSDGHH